MHRTTKIREAMARLRGPGLKAASTGGGVEPVEVEVGDRRRPLGRSVLVTFGEFLDALGQLVVQLGQGEVAVLVVIALGPAAEDIKQGPGEGAVAPSGVLQADLASHRGRQDDGAGVLGDELAKGVDPAGTLGTGDAGAVASVDEQEELAWDVLDQALDLVPADSGAAQSFQVDLVGRQVVIVALVADAVGRKEKDG